MVKRKYCCVTNCILVMIIIYLKDQKALIQMVFCIGVWSRDRIGRTEVYQIIVDSKK